jgi:hypothetical protein
MKVIGFDGRSYKIKLPKYQRAACSKYHKKAKEIITQIFPFEPIHEEVVLPGSKCRFTGSLYADFFLPNQIMIVEVHGEQHYKYLPFFHSSKLDFMKSQKRDKQKIEWCNLNNIKIVILPYNKESEWKNLLKE